MAEAAIIVHTYEQALAALEAAGELHVPVTLQSAPDAIFYAGSLYLLQLFEQARKSFPNVEARFVIDCADAGAETIAAIQMGHKHLRSSAAEAARAKLADIAAQQGAVMVSEPCETLDLLEVRDTAAACREWLANHTKS